MNCNEFADFATGIKPERGGWRTTHVRRGAILPLVFSIFLAVVFSLGTASPVRAQKVSEKTLLKNLPPGYKEWLERDVVYLITKEERDTFLRLTTDEARDTFIDKFWDLRNPDPGSPSNSYKD